MTSNKPPKGEFAREMWLFDYFKTKDICPTGSRHIEWPPKLTTDDDYLIFIDGCDINYYREKLVEEGWTDCLDQDTQEGFERYQEEGVSLDAWGAFRIDDINVMIYESKYLYDASCAATFLCQKLNVKDKEQRIRIFRWFKFNEPLKAGDLSYDG